MKKLYREVGIYIMKHTNFQNISLKETREKWARVFFFCIDHARMRIKGLWRHKRVWEGESRMPYLQVIFVKIVTRFWRWKFRIRNSYPMDRMSSILQWRLLKFNCCLLCFQTAVFCYFLFSKRHFVLRASSPDDLTGRGVTSRLISLFIS